MNYFPPGQIKRFVLLSDNGKRSAAIYGCGPFRYKYRAVSYFSLSAAWAAARRAMGTRKGEQLT